jgi:hypothetical protein
VGRALARLAEDQWSLVREPDTVDGTVETRRISIHNAELGETRHILAYTITAINGTPFLYQLDKHGKVVPLTFRRGASPALTPNFADGETRTFYTVTVERDGQFEM